MQDPRDCSDEVRSHRRRAFTSVLDHDATPITAATADGSDLWQLYRSMLRRSERKPREAKDLRGGVSASLAQTADLHAEQAPGFGSGLSVVDYVVMVGRSPTERSQRPPRRAQCRDAPVQRR